MTAPVSGGRDTTFVPLVIEDLVVPDSLKPGDRRAPATFDEYKASKMGSVKPSPGTWRDGTYEGDTPEETNDRRRAAGDDADRLKDGGAWRNDTSAHRKITAADAQKFEEKRGNIASAKATAVSLQNASLNAQRQNAQDSIRMSQYLV